VPHPVIPLLSLYPFCSTTLDLKGGRERGLWINEKEIYIETLTPPPTDVSLFSFASPYRSSFTLSLYVAL
jgi:hypothetical protein